MDLPTRLHNDLTREYDTIWDQVSGFLGARGRDIPDWPEWCYMPMAGAYAIVSGGGSLPKRKRPDISKVAAIAAWRPTRTIVKVDPARLQSLWEGEVPEEVSAADLSSLPVWGPYIDLQGVDDASAEGAILHLEHDANDGHAEFRGLLVQEDLSTTPAVIDLGRSLEEGARSVVEEAVRVAHEEKEQAPVELGVTEAMTERARPLLSIALYLASSESIWHPERPTRPARSTVDPPPQSTVYTVQ
jgi:hypothetical protein